MRSGAFALLVLFVSGAIATAAPTIAVDSPTYAFPDTISGVAVVHSFVLANVGDEDLVVSRVSTSCGCTTMTLAQTLLAPGESVPLVAVFDTEGFRGTVTKRVTVTSNDPVTPALELELRGTVLARPAYQTSISRLIDAAYLIVDVRDPASYEAGHVLGSLNVPLADLGARAAALPPTLLTIVVDAKGETSTLTEAVTALRAGGLWNVYALRGGLDAWQSAYGEALIVVDGTLWGAFEDVSGVRNVPKGTPPLQLVDAKTVRGWAYVIVDLRAPDAFAAGHLAGAVNVAEEDAFAYVEALPYDVPVYLVSDDGAASDRTAIQFSGRRNSVWSLVGGLDEWRRQRGGFLFVASLTE